MKSRYIRAMDAIHNACLFVAGLCLVVITLIVPYGVFTRYVLNSAASWPEPMAVLLMIVMSFLSAVVCYREYLHIGVGVLPALLAEPAKSVLGWFLEACMLVTNLFMLVWGIKLVQTTWFQGIAEFPIVSAGMAWCQVAWHSLMPHTSMNRFVASISTSRIQPRYDLAGSCRNVGRTPTPMCRYSR